MPAASRPSASPTTGCAGGWPATGPGTVPSSCSCFGRTGPMRPGTGYFSTASGTYLPEILEKVLGHVPVLPAVAGSLEAAGKTPGRCAHRPGSRRQRRCRTRRRRASRRRCGVAGHVRDGFRRLGDSRPRDARAPGAAHRRGGRRQARPRPRAARLTGPGRARPHDAGSDRARRPACAARVARDADDPGRHADGVEPGPRQAAGRAARRRCVPDQAVQPARAAADDRAARGPRAARRPRRTRRRAARAGRRRARRAAAAAGFTARPLHARPAPGGRGGTRACRGALRGQCPAHHSRPAEDRLPLLHQPRAAHAAEPHVGGRHLRSRRRSSRPARDHRHDPAGLRAARVVRAARARLLQLARRRRRRHRWP